MILFYALIGIFIAFTFFLWDVAFLVGDITDTVTEAIDDD